MKKDKLEKIKELARRGIGGEKASARDILVEKILNGELKIEDGGSNIEDEIEDEIGDEVDDYYEYDNSMTLEMMRKMYCSSYIIFYQMFLELRPEFTVFYVEQKYDLMKKDFGKFLFSLDQTLFNDIVKYLQREKI